MPEGSTVRLGRTIASMALLCGIVAAAVFAWQRWHRVDETVLTTTSVRTTSLTDLVQTLADQMTGSIGPANTYQIVPIKQASYPVGTLVSEREPWNPVNKVACKPAQAPEFLSAPNLFANSYALDLATAIDIGLTPAIRDETVKADIGLSDSRTARLGFQKVAISALASDDIDQVLAGDACRKAVANRPVMIVRGIIRGRRSFTLQRAVGNGGKVETRLGSFTVKSGDGSSSLLLADDEPEEFLEILSVLSVPDKPAPGEPAKVQVSAPSQGRIYLQRDAADDPARATTVRDALAQAGYNVVRGIEAVPTEKMPRRAEVRYFNASDQARADAVRQMLAATFPDAVIKPLRNSSPPGQLEVWLPRSGTPQ